MKKNWFVVMGAIIFTILVSGYTTLKMEIQSDESPWSPSTAEVLCGNGSEADDYGFTYNLQQYHWTVDGERYLEQATIDELDTIFDQLVDDNVVETMLLFKPVNEVGNRVNCAVHFLRYMQLGQPSGTRKDNGFVFLFVVEEDAIDVHYGVGLGLPALTAHNLTELNRMAEEIYADTGSMDKAVLTMAYSYANYAREQYPPLAVQAAVPVQSVPYQSEASTDNFSNLPLQIGGMSGVLMTCLCCISIIVLVLLVMIFSRFGRRRRYFPPVISRGPTIWRPTSGRSGGFGGSGGFSPPRMRGGGGSGRSNRGN